ncbi:acyltransferase family protein [Aliarcobacter butzleri]|uniref:acyltransferase family protein n=1 Tax=Aliarcobacter butzleri TaxID=28197 RepID=UPI0021B36A27|nr:acyltransferase [Aliarcobacter butzleri]MCT7568968.1 acyltransferase [Aliarcobacter butzleri]
MERDYGGGAIAVELFFIISGFYMALILNEKYNTSDKIVVFYKNRFLKLFPIYWTVLIFTIVYLVVYKSDTLEYILNNINNFRGFSVYILFSNIFLLGEDLLMFLGFNGNEIVFTKYFSDTEMPLHKFIIVPQSWTLSLEIIFYLIAPFLIRKNIRLLIYLFIISVFIKIGLWNIGFSNDPWSYRFILSELSFFFIGMIMYRVYKMNFYSKFIKNKSLFLFGFIPFLLSGYFYFRLKHILEFNDIDILKYLIYILFVLFLPFLFEYTKNNKVDRYIGELSYPIYIVHIFVIMISPHIRIDIDLGLFAIIGSILFSIVLNKFIQERVEKIRIKNLKEKN